MTDEPVLLTQCRTLYEKMQASAVDGQWSGNLTVLIGEIGLHPAYFTPLTRALVAMGCAEKVQRGGPGRPSIWRLVQEPTPELFSGIDKRELRHSRSQEVRISELESRVEKLEVNTGGLDIPAAFQELEGRMGPK